MRERYVAWPVTAKILFWLLIVVVVIPFLFAAVIYLIPTEVDEGKFTPGGLVAPTIAEAHFRDDDRRNLNRAYEHFSHGHRDHARTYTRRVRHWAHVPVRIRKRLQTTALTHEEGCKDASVQADRDIPLIGTDLLFSAFYVTRWCFNNGNVQRVDRVINYHGVTSWGRQLNWNYAGMAPWLHESKWVRWHDRAHGSYVIRKVAQFEQCTPVFGGCGLFYQRKNNWMRIRMFGDGTWTSSVGG